MSKKKTKEDFIKEATEKHEGKYDYSKVEYVNTRTKVCIICPEHGEFCQTPTNHTKGQGCPKCGVEKSHEIRRSSKEEFIKKSREAHGVKYDYSKVEYVNNRTKVCIICPKHGEFWQIPDSHTRGCGCTKCKGDKIRERQTLTNEEFIKKSRSKHGDKYDYSKVEYVGVKTKVRIICPEHGEFWQWPADHTNGRGCPNCGIKNCSEKKTSTKEKFIRKARSKHGDKYDYSNVDYVNSKTKVCIICPEHGEFCQEANNHLAGSGCPKCKADKTRERCTLTKEEFIKKACEKHGDKYDYTKMNYVDYETKVCIICPEHGIFEQKPHIHLSGSGCHKCGIEKKRESLSCSKEEFIKKVHKIHGDKYDYSKVEYVNNRTKVCIICPKHGEFWQTPSEHLARCGCHKCNLSHLERSMMNYLDEVGITYDYQKHFDWLGRQSLDFYLPDYKVGIECQGGQHFFPIDYFGGEDSLIECQKRDKRKFKRCDKHGIKLLYYSNLGIEYPYTVFEDLNLLFEEIKK